VHLGAPLSRTLRIQFSHTWARAQHSAKPTHRFAVHTGAMFMGGYIKAKEHTANSCFTLCHALPFNAVKRTLVAGSRQKWWNLPRCNGVACA